MKQVKKFNLHACPAITVGRFRKNGKECCGICGKQIYKNYHTVAIGQKWCKEGICTQCDGIREMLKEKERSFI